MKTGKLISRIRRHARRIPVLALAAVSSAEYAMAQSNTGRAASGSDFQQLKNIEDSLKNAGGRVVSIVSIMIGLVGVIMLAWVFYKRSKGDQQSNDALMGWGVALIFAMIMLQIVRAIFFNGATS